MCIRDSVKDEDWSENWKQFFKPLKIGEKILIQPQWQPLKEGEAEGRTVFKVNPGMTFGTGSHDSTRFCIEEIEKHIKSGDTVLDLGCGSGILSIIALLLGAESCDAVDIDPNAVDVAYSNLELNGVEKERYHVVHGDVIENSELRATFKTYDLSLIHILTTRGHRRILSDGYRGWLCTQKRWLITMSGLTAAAIPTGSRERKSRLSPA